MKRFAHTKVGRRHRHHHPKKRTTGSKRESEEECGVYVCGVHSFCHFLDQKEAALCESSEYRFYVCLYVCMCVCTYVCVHTFLFNMHQFCTLIGFCKLLIWLNVIFCYCCTRLANCQNFTELAKFSTYYILIVFLSM